MSARIVEVILTNDRRGLGTPDDPVRLVPQLWTKDGRLIMERDGYTNTCLVTDAIWAVS